MTNTSNAQKEAPPPQITIETPRLILRGAKLSDTDDLFECFKDEEAMRYWNTPAHTTPETTKKWVESMIRGANNGLLDFVICLKPTPTTSTPNGHISTNIDTPNETKVIGKAGIWHSSELGFLLHRSHWGHGLAIEAVTAILDRAFNLPIPPLSSTSSTSSDSSLAPTTTTATHEDIVADVDPRNTASLRLLNKLGFEVYATQERTLLVGEEWVDSVYLSLKREVWVRGRWREG